MQAGDPRSAIPHLSKLKKPLTPGDSIDAWMTYTLQYHINWDAAAVKVGLAEITGRLVNFLEVLAEKGEYFNWVRWQSLCVSVDETSVRAEAFASCQIENRA